MSMFVPVSLMPSCLVLLQSCNPNKDVWLVISILSFMFLLLSCCSFLNKSIKILAPAFVPDPAPFPVPLYYIYSSQPWPPVVNIDIKNPHPHQSTLPSMKERLDLGLSKKLYCILLPTFKSNVNYCKQLKLS